MASLAGVSRGPCAERCLVPARRWCPSCLCRSAEKLFLWSRRRPLGPLHPCGFAARRARTSSLVPPRSCCAYPRRRASRSAGVSWLSAPSRARRTAPCARPAPPRPGARAWPRGRPCWTSASWSCGAAPVALVKRGAAPQQVLLCRAMSRAAWPTASVGRASSAVAPPSLRGGSRACSPPAKRLAEQPALQGTGLVSKSASRLPDTPHRPTRCAGDCRPADTETLGRPTALVGTRPRTRHKEGAPLFGPSYSIPAKARPMSAAGVPQILRAWAASAQRRAARGPAPAAAAARAGAHRRRRAAADASARSPRRLTRLARTAAAAVAGAGARPIQRGHRRPTWPSGSRASRRAVLRDSSRPHPCIPHQIYRAPSFCAATPASSAPRARRRADHALEDVARLCSSRRCRRRRRAGASAYLPRAAATRPGLPGCRRA